MMRLRTMIDLFYKLPNQNKRRFVVYSSYQTVARFIANLLNFYWNKTPGKDYELFMCLKEKE